MITRTVRKILCFNADRLAFEFCLNKALLNPYKHITMNHNLHNMFQDQYHIGVYPEVILPSSVAARTYQSVVVSTAVDVINQKFKTHLTANDFNNNLQKPWARFIKKNLNSSENINDVLTPILNRLASTIIVRESKWTWIKEQKQRLIASPTYFLLNKPETLEDFLNSYNALIEMLVLASSFGHCPYIPQAVTTLEKHYVQEMQESVRGEEGIQELNNLDGQRDNFINKMMRLIHKL